jgi:hypothetical protein
VAITTPLLVVMLSVSLMSRVQPDAIGERSVPLLLGGE